MRFFAIVLCVMLLLVGFGTSVSGQETGNPIIHTVAPGETLYRIALRYNTTVAAIASANRIANVNLIYAGQQLVIPGTDGGTTPQPTTPPTGETQVYVVVAGDTLGRIAQRFGTSVQAIAAANGITNINLIFVGQQLTIPGGGGSIPLPTAIPGPGSTPVPTGPGLSGFALGGHVESFAYPDTMRQAGMTWVKRQVRWNQGDSPEIARGVIDDAHAKGFKILLGIAGDKGQLANNPTQYYQDFANFLGGVAAMGPDAIEVWNEPNIDREWPAGQISGGNYTQMLSAAYQAIKAQNSSVVVVSAAPAPTGFFGGTCQAGGCDDNIFISQMRNAGAANFMDCVGLHYNEGIVPPSSRSGDPRGNSSHYTRYYPAMVDLYAGTFPSKPLCFTELGYLSPEGFGPLPAGFEWAADTTVQEHATWLGDAVRLARQGGRVRLLIVWNVDFTNYEGDPMAGFAIIRNNECPACNTLAGAMR